MYGGFFGWFNHDKRYEQLKKKDGMQSKSAMSEDYKKARARKKRKQNK